MVTEATGQGFTGYKEYTPEDGQPQKETINGVIAPDGDILITDDDGFTEGTLSGTTFSGQYAQVGEDSTAMNVEWTKQ